MNKGFKYTGFLASLILLSSCNTVRNTVALSDIEGEWNIVRINGESLQIPSGEQQPFIGFDTRSGKIYGNSGCNRIMASMDLQAKPDTIEFGRMGATMMTCSNMQTESEVLAALSEAKSYRKASNGKISLCNSSNCSVAILKKRFYPMTVAELQEECHVMSVFNCPMPETTEKAPCLIFDTKGNKISGNVGCNRLTGKLNINGDNKLSISILPVATTRMTCPGLETENNILSTLSSVKTFERLDLKRIVLYTSGGSEVLVLQKNKQK